VSKASESTNVINQDLKVMMVDSERRVASTKKFHAAGGDEPKAHSSFHVSLFQ